MILRRCLSILIIAGAACLIAGALTQRAVMAVYGLHMRLVPAIFLDAFIIVTLLPVILAVIDWIKERKKS